nr:LuxR family transcriptional regulator [Micromonospora sp. DSM 115978]
MHTEHEDKIRVAILSNRRLFRDALVSWLASQPEFMIVGHVAAEEDLLQLCALLEPGLVLFDAGRTVPAALPTLDLLRDRFPRTRVVVVYDHLSPADLTAARRNGVHTLVPGSHGLPALLAVLRREAATLADRPGDRPNADLLTEQEREIIALVGAGHTVQRIAELLRSTPCAVENSKRRIYHKLGVVSQSQAVARAAALGLTGPGPSGAAPPGGAGDAAARPPSRSRWAAPRPPDGDRRLPQLTSRETDILRSIAMGHTVRQTARLLDIAEKTVENTQARLFLKLGARNRAGAIAAAHRIGLLDLVAGDEGEPPPVGPDHPRG